MMKKSIRIEADMVPADGMMHRAFEKVNLENLMLINRSLAWALNNDKGTQSIQSQIDEYNQYVTKLEQNKDFYAYMEKSSFCLRKQELVKMLGKETAQTVFPLKQYPFETPLVVQADFFLPLGFPVTCRATVHGETVAFTVAESSEGYPSQSTNGSHLYLWDWSWDLRDFTAYLYEIFDSLGMIPDDTDEEGDSRYDYGHYECYEQGREVMDVPNENLLACLATLEEAGYLTIYALTCPQAQGWFVCRGRQDESIGLATLDAQFSKDLSLMKFLQTLLIQPH